MNSKMTTMAAKKSPKKRTLGANVKAATGKHPAYQKMIEAALETLKERNGSSRQAILKYILAYYEVGDAGTVNTHLKQALKRGVINGDFIQSKGVGASGSFRLNRQKRKTMRPKKTRGTKSKLLEAHSDDEDPMTSMPKKSMGKKLTKSAIKAPKMPQVKTATVPVKKTVR